MINRKIKQIKENHIMPTRQHKQEREIEIEQQQEFGMSM